jgi:hypothetical protein
MNKTMLLVLGLAGAGVVGYVLLRPRTAAASTAVTEAQQLAQLRAIYGAAPVAAAGASGAPSIGA